MEYPVYERERFSSKKTVNIRCGCFWHGSEDKLWNFTSSNSGEIELWLNFLNQCFEILFKSWRLRIKYIFSSILSLQKMDLLIFSDNVNEGDALYFCESNELSSKSTLSGILNCSSLAFLLNGVNKSTDCKGIDK